MYVYLLRSTSHPDQHYIGLTTNLKHRLTQHNTGQSPHTSKFTPWQLVTAIYFANHQKAQDFERYLKHGSGHAFASRQLW